MGGAFTPQIVIPGWIAGGVHALWVSEDPPQRMHIIFVPATHQGEHAKMFKEVEKRTKIL